MKRRNRCTITMTGGFIVEGLKTITAASIEIAKAQNSSATTAKDSGVKYSKNGKPVEKVDPRCICIRTAFRPLGLLAKCFGLFPCYNLSFREGSSSIGCRRLKLFHILEYMYSGLILLLLTGGSILVYIQPPSSIVGIGDDPRADTADFLVIMATIYGQLLMGILSLFIFPRNFCMLLRYIEHFAQVDKILQFSRASKEEEFGIGIRMVRLLFLTLLSFALLYAGMFLLEGMDQPKCYTDFVVIAVLTLAGMMSTIPTALLLFFLNGIRLRLKSFNDKLEKLVIPITPSSFLCASYADYARELEGQVCQRKCNTLAEDLEKMRVLHEEISGLVDETSNVFGTHILREYLFCIGGVVLYTYFIVALQNLELEYWFLYIFLDVYVVAKLLLVSRLSHRVTTEGSASLRVLNKVSLSQLTPDCSFQIQTFVRKLHNTRAVSAAGYFTVNLSMVSSILGAITTYFVILVQFKVTDYSKDLKNVIKCGHSHNTDFMSSSLGFHQLEKLGL